MNPSPATRTGPGGTAGPRAAGRRRLPLLVLAVLAVATGACSSGPGRGEVVGRPYTAAYTSYSRECSSWHTWTTRRTTGRSGSRRTTTTRHRTCTAYRSVPRRHPAAWYLRLRDGSKVADRAVDATVWRLCPEHTHYPECARGR